MTDYRIPQRKYCDGEKKLIAMRLPKKLLRELDAVSKEKGWTVTDVVTTVLDQFVQGERKLRK